MKLEGQKVTPPTPEWVKVGISGFDELFDKGIPKGANLIVTGGPGTGKTIFCLQTLYNAAREGHDVLYISFEEAPIRLWQHMREFGWDVEDVEVKGGLWIVSVKGPEKSGTMIIRRLDPHRISRSVEGLLAKAAREITIELGTAAELIPPPFDSFMIAFDSVTALESAFTGRPENYRIYIEQLFRLFEDIGSTNFLVTEIEMTTNRSSSPGRFSRTGVEEFLADGVIVLYNFRAREARVRALEVLKLRGARHRGRVVPIQITEKGLRVFPTESVYEMPMA